MFRPRLFEYFHAQEVHSTAVSKRTALENRITDLDKVVAQQERDTKTLDERIASLAAEITALPKQQCTPISGNTREGRPWRTIRCITDPRTITLQEALRQATTDRDTAAQKRDRARAEAASARLELKTADEELRSAETSRKEAVLHSQLHSFTGMLFGKSPHDVTDGEVFLFLRIFVFAPAFFVAFVSASIASTGVIRIEPKTIEIPNDAGDILSRDIEETMKDAHDAAAKAARDQHDDDRGG